MTTHIIQGDARQTGLPNAHFHCVATSPPYFGLREYGDDEREIGDEKTPDEYIDEMRKVGREVCRVLRDDGTWWLNLGDSFAGSGTSGNRGTSSLNGTLDHQKNTSHQKPKTTRADVPSKNLLMIPQRVALALQADGWIVRAQIPWVKASCMPESVRDRPTVAHEYVFLLVKSQRYFWDADAVRMPSTEVGTSQRFSTKRASGYGVKPSGNETDPSKGERSSTRNLRTSDFFHAGLDEYERHLARVRENGGLLLSPEGDPLAFMVNPVGNKLAHFAMWPPRLVAPMIKASTSEKGCCPKCGAQCARIVDREPGFVARRETNDGVRGNRYGSAKNAQYRGIGITRATTLGFSPSCECNAGDPIPCRVLDPFAGSGTTMQVCEALGRDSWGVELMAKNIPIIGERLKEKLDPELMKPIKTERAKRARNLETA
jgi:hypothetical protein